MTHPQQAARMIVAAIDGDQYVQELVAVEVAQSENWPQFAAALAALAAAVCRETDDPDGARALWLHGLAASL
ncbi:hypothetical protein [Tomitella biformata]|uniref:hypothetical protein n=1 Tax=Tomitella biformata TaxID=630403 RepID=UPI0011DCD59E|nr:hypothetical protein [Tomitella biformata]